MALQNIEANITLDLYNHDTTPSTVKAIQLDSQTRYVAARLQNMGAQYDVDSGATVQLIVVRPDKVGVQITGTTFAYGDEGASFLGPYAELTQVALAVNGKMRGQFKITSGTQILRTEIFAISNGVALDASTDEWADEYDGYNLEEMATSIETNTADIATLEADVSQIKEDLSSGRLNYYDNSYLSGLADDFYKIDNTATWEQGSWTSSGDVDANTWIRTPSANKLSGGFLIHNKNTQFGFFVAKYNATTGVWAGYYGPSDALNTNEYTYIPVQSNVVYRLRIRYVANASTPLSPSENMIDIYRGLGVEARFRNSPSFVGLTGSDYDNTFANIAGVANVITNLAYSQWSDIPFGGAAISTQYTTNYDLQVIFGIGTNAIAYRFVSRSTKAPYNNWQITTDTQLSGKKIAIIGDSRSSYQGTVPSGNAYYYPKSSGAVLTSLSDMWWKQLADFFGMELTVNDSYSGGYVANKDGGNGANILSSDTAINNLGATVPDIIIIFAGVNDWNANAVQIGNYDGTGAFPSDNSTFREAFAILLSKVQKKFPNADIWVCTNPYCCPAGTGSTISEMPVPKAGNGGVSLKVFNDAIRELAEVFGCGVIDFTKCGTNWGNLVTYTGDYDTDNGLHYNASGHQLLFETARNTLYQYYKAND